MKTSRRFFLFSAAPLVVLLAGCPSSNTAQNGGNSAPVGPNDAAPGDPKTADIAPGQVKEITIGYNPTIVQPQALVGLIGGRYGKELPGISVNGRSYDAGPAVLEALRAGVVQIACSGPFPAMKAFIKDGDVVLLSGAASGGTQLMVAKNSPIKSVKDLKGKVIGVNQLGSTVESLVRSQVLAAGMDLQNDVKFIEIKPGEQANALKHGEVAAVAAPAPWPSQVQIAADARPLLDWKQIYNGGNYLAGSFYTTKDFASKNPAFIKKFLAANTKITNDLNANRVKGDAEVLKAWEQATQKTIKPDIAKAAFATIQFTTEADEDALQKFADLNYKLGTLRDKPDLKGFVWKTE